MATGGSIIYCVLADWQAQQRGNKEELYHTKFFTMAQQPQWTKVSSLSRIHDHRYITLGRTPLDEWSARRRDLYLTIHNTHKRQTFIPQA